MSAGTGGGILGKLIAELLTLVVEEWARKNSHGRSPRKLKVAKAARKTVTTARRGVERVR